MSARGSGGHIVLEGGSAAGACAGNLQAFSGSGIANGGDFSLCAGDTMGYKAAGDELETPTLAPSEACNVGVGEHLASIRHGQRREALKSGACARGTGEPARTHTVASCAATVSWH